MSIFTYHNLYQAYLDCRKNKRSTVNALKFEINLENNLIELLEELKSGSYRPGMSICFVVTEPCPREIFAADFRDRIVHHLFVRELIDKAEKLFIYDSYACRTGKGTHKAVRRLVEFKETECLRLQSNRRHSVSSRGWYMKLDIKSFFMSIDKNILYDLTLDLIDRHKRPDGWKNKMADLAGIIIFHCPQKNYIRKGDPALAGLIPAHKSLLGRQANKGLPIGNYTSQFFANLYLNKLDHFIKRELKCRYFLRYVDDLLLLSEEREQLKYCRDKIGEFLKVNLCLELNHKKTVIQPIGRGIDFLGYFIKPDKILARRKVLGRCKNKLYKAALGLDEAPWPRARAIAASYAGHAGHFG